MSPLTHHQQIDGVVQERWNSSYIFLALTSLIARFVGPIWGRQDPGGPCWPHEPCYLGYLQISTSQKLIWRARRLSQNTLSKSIIVPVLFWYVYICVYLMLSARGSIMSVGNGIDWVAIKIYIVLLYNWWDIVPHKIVSAIWQCLICHGYATYAEINICIKHLFRD